MVLYYIGITFVVAMLMGVPIAFILGLIPLGYLVFFSNMPLTVIGQTLFNGADSYILLAIPFFISASILMNRTGITRDLINFANLIVGRLPGSLAQVNIVSSMIFAGITGAAVADAAALGGILIPAMKEEGYSSSYSAAVTATSSIIGPIIPPSIIMVIYGSITGDSIGALFMAGFVPGIMVGVSLMIVALYYAIRDKHPRRMTGYTLKESAGIVRNALLAIMMPVIIIGGILSGKFTPTEAAAIACAYAFIVGFFIYRQLTVKELIDSLKEGAITSAAILLIIAAAKLFGLMMSIEALPQQIAEVFMSISTNKYVFLLIVNIFLLFMGMIMETGANVILLAPILIPIAIQYGIHPLHFALVVLVNVNIGLVTPPLGVCLFVVAPIAKTSYENVVSKIFPFLMAEVTVLFLITYIPELILFVPRMFGFVA
ncbi:MAG: TRAP transporter large permease [Deltaproteobacteria bacterium]|nr:TRAP transporter large permease [Deltaproteobacteria bacterium]